MTNLAFDVAFRVAQAIESCGLTYLIGGSLASSVSGEPRSTIDIDIVVALNETDIPCLREALGAEFYADEAAIRRAVRRRSSVNLIHQPTAIKIDLFVAGGTPLDRQQLARRQRVQIGSSPGQSLYFHTPEDILLQKLRWFRASGDASDRQWRDVLGIAAVQADRLDWAYLREHSAAIGVADLVERVSLDQQIRMAITNHRLLEVTYHGGTRIGEPQDYGVQKGTARLLFYQLREINGKRPARPGWRLLTLPEIESCRVLEDTFPGSRGGQHARHADWDQLFARVT